MHYCWWTSRNRGWRVERKEGREQVLLPPPLVGVGGDARQHLIALNLYGREWISFFNKFYLYQKRFCCSFCSLAVPYDGFGL